MFISRRAKAGIEKNFVLLVGNLRSITNILENTTETNNEQNDSIRMLLEISTTQQNVIESLTERVEKLEARQPTSYRLS